MSTTSAQQTTVAARPRYPSLPLALLLLVVVSITTSCSDDARSTDAGWRLIAHPCAGSGSSRATAAAIGPQLVATVAHSLERVSSVELRAAAGEVVDAEIVFIDPAKDIALLRTHVALPDHLTMTAPERPGPVGILAVDDDDRAVVARGEITELIDITLDGEGRRAAARLSADIEPGDSGAAVLDDDGQMVAMVFASGRGGRVGWAVSAAEIEVAVASLDANRPGFEPPAC